MADVIGESFNDFVKDQIDKRQTFLKSSTNYSNEFHLYNSKTSFLRLTSGVTVDEDVCKRIGFDNVGVQANKGDGLAKNFVLFASQFLDPNINVSKIDDKSGNQFTDTFRLTGGIGYGYGYNSLPPSQGFLSSPEFGFVPPPGIESATIKTLNKGTLKEATIKITAHNLIQFRVIEALFLRLRYSLLLEWGHSVYLNNTAGDYKINQIDSTYDLFRTFLKNPGSQKDMQTRIEALRQKSCGNYDAFLGVIKNFNWSLKSNGTYDITVIAISTGDVIESLKVNTSFNLGKKIEDINAYFPPQFLKSTLHAYCREVQLNTEWNYAQYSAASYESAPLYNKAGGRNTLNSSIGGGLGIQETFSNNGTGNNLPEAFRMIFPYFGASSFYVAGSDGNNPKFAQYYIRLGALLRFIEAFLLEYDTSKGTSEPIFRIDHNRYTNKFLTIPLQVSTDPTVCVIPVNSKGLEQNATLQYELREYTVDCDFVRPFGSADKNIDQYNTQLRRSGFNEGYGEATSSDVATVTAQATIGTKELNQFYIKSITVLRNNGAGGPGNTEEVLDFESNPIKIDIKYEEGSYFLTDSLHKTKSDGITWGNLNNYENKKFGFGNIVLEQIKTKNPNWQNDYIYTSYALGGGEVSNKIDVKVTYFVYTTISTGTAASVVSTNSWPVGMAHIQYHMENDFRIDDYTARTMDILVNLGNVMDILDTKIDKNGNIDVLKFLKTLMSNIGGALGGMNDFEVTFDDVDNTFRIIDNTYVANSGKDNITELQINLLKDTSGTFVKDVSLKTELTARIANAIAAGAQKNGNTMVSNGTTFAKFNEGYVDRIIEKKQNKNNITDSDNEAYKSRLNILYNYITKLFSIAWSAEASNSAPIVTSEEAQAANGASKDIYEYELGYLTNGKKDKKGNDIATLKGTMFIPLNLQVTVDGLSGIKQYQLFKTNQELLPSDYHDRLAFIVKGLTHKIDDKGWTTNIETLAVKRFNKGTTQNNSLGTVASIKVPDPVVAPKEDSKSDTPITIGGDNRYLPIKDIAARGEGVYDSINGSARGTGIDNNRITTVFGKNAKEFTISEIAAKANKRAAETEWSSAIGKYQQLGKYLVDRAKKAGLNPDVDKYDEANQEKIAENLLDGQVGNYIKGINSGDVSQLAQAVQSIGQIWSSKPITIKQQIDGKEVTGNFGDVTTGNGTTGYYSSGNNPKVTKITVGEVVKALIDTRKNFVDNTKKGVGGLPEYIPPYYT
jgi:muramidase (phage lysozyme)